MPKFWQKGKIPNSPHVRANRQNTFAMSSILCHWDSGREGITLAKWTDWHSDNTWIRIKYFDQHDDEHTEWWRHISAFYLLTEKTEKYWGNDYVSSELAQMTQAHRAGPYTR